MKYFYSNYICISLLLIFSHCKKDPGNQLQTEDTFEKLSTLINVSGKAAKVFQDTFYQYYDTLRALHAAGSFLSEQSEVQSGFYVSKNLIRYTLKNGLSSSLYFIETDANGIHQFRGDGSLGSLKRFSCQNTTVQIKNEKVLVLNPYLDQFDYPNHSYESYLPYFEGGNIKLEVTHYDKRDVRLSQINSMDNYGMVILNTHGRTNSFSLFDLATISIPEASDYSASKASDLLKKADNYPMDKFENGELELSSSMILNTGTKTIQISLSIDVTDDYIKNSNLNLKDVVVFGNHCYSGFTSPFSQGDNMVEAWKSKNVGTYYGFAFENGMSIKVDDKFCRQVEIGLIKRLAQDNDTTGDAHLSASGLRQSQTVLINPSILELDLSFEKNYSKFSRYLNRAPGGDYPYPFYFTKFFAGNLKWGCPETLLDERDGKTYKVACIGDQVWMAENLNWDGAGICNKCNSYGRLYSISELTGLQTSNDSNVRGICPKGWHVPSQQEFEKLFTSVGGVGIAADKLRSKSGWPSSHSDQFGFNLLPSGHYNPASGYVYEGSDAKLWTSSKETSFFIAVNAYHPGLYLGNYSATNPEWHFSCRCVKD